MARVQRALGGPSFDHKGVHFVGLVNVANLKAGGMGSLGHEQLEWLEDDLRATLPTLRLCSMRTFPCGLSIRIGAGEPTMMSKLCLTSSVSAL